MKQLSLIVIVGFLLSLPVSTFAAGYGAAGCGLGSMLIGPQSGPGQIFAATTNGTFGSQTFGITSGTSNCGDNGLLNLSKEREIFAQQNYTGLVKEMAQGEGEILYTLAGLYQCPTDSHQAFGSMTQERFEYLVMDDQTTSTDLLSQLESELTQHPQLASSCNIKLSALN